VRHSEALPDYEVPNKAGKTTILALAGIESNDDNQILHKERVHVIQIS
jgi:hypothetical protein